MSWKPVVVTTMSGPEVATSFLRWHGGLKSLCLGNQLFVVTSMSGPARDQHCLPAVQA